MACVRKWRGKWVVDWRDPSGKRFIETVDGDRDAAKRRLGEILKTGEQAASKRLTFKDYAERWLENFAKATIKQSTYAEYERAFKVHLYPLFGSKPLVKVTRKMVREMIAAKQQDQRSQSTIKNILAPMRGMYNQAIDDGDAFENPAARVGKFNKRKDPAMQINPLTREEVKTLLDKTREKSPHWYPLLLCATRTGMREGELIALTGANIDFRGQFIEVQRILSRGELTTPKNGKTRRVDMSGQLKDVLQDILSRKRAEALRNEMEKPASERRDTATVVNEAMDDWLFKTPAGTQLDPSNLRKVFSKLLTDAKLRRIRFHDLRHSFASLLIGHGESLPYVRDQLGHHSIQITVDTYGHLVPGGNRQAVDRLDDVTIRTAETTEADTRANVA
ncbi:MAG: site-specific integrase [Deltaproteobacteria bacterium]|nr:site-specific integrase [Deltaproteobacteria bacterium]